MRHSSNHKLTFILVLLAFWQFSAYGQTREGNLRIESSARLDEMVAQKKEYNKSVETNQGFKIQIYYGTEKGCYEVKEEFSLLFPDMESNIIFSTPQWKLQVGNFRTRLEADNAIVGIKKEYPAAIVLATTIELK